MPLHQSSGRWQLGLALSCLTALLWGILPVALTIALQGLDIYTLTWVRFLSSFGLLAIYLAFEKNSEKGKTGISLLPSFRLSRSEIGLLAIATVCMGLDYVLFMEGLARTSPANAEVLIQFAPILMSLGAIAIFKERYTSTQWTGVGILTLGFVLFFNEQLKTLITTPTRYLLGSGLIVLAAITWATYALAQKQLLRHLPSSHIMLIIYTICTLAFSPVAVPERILTLNSLYLGVVIFCSLSSLVSYGAFAESLEHWEASKIGAIHALTPIFTLGSVWLVSRFAPTLLTPERITALGFLGAVLVILGSMTIALGDDKNRINKVSLN